jgi:RDD family
MALFGVRVVTDDSTDASGRRAVVRTLAVPLSFLFLGLGFAGILLGDRRRALHDVIAGRRSSTPGTRGRRGWGSRPGADHAAASCPCRFFIRPGRAAARVSRRRSRWGSGCLLV